MKKDNEKYSFECECAGPGHCPVYGVRMGEHSYHKCKNDQSWRLHYLDYVYSEPKAPTVYDDGSWSMGNTFEGVIGIKSEIKPHTFI